MSKAKSLPEYVGRRGELLAELFLQDLEPEFVARATKEVGYSFLVGFRNSRGGVNNIAVEVKATEHVVQNRFPLGRKKYSRLAYSNIPVLFIVVDVKENRFFFTWISSDAVVTPPGSSVVGIRLTEINAGTRAQLREQLAS